MNVKDYEVKKINESLKKENITKEREIRRLNKDIQQYELTITSLRNELSMSKYEVPDIPKKDAEACTDTCTGIQECGDVEPVKELGGREEVHCGDVRRIKSASLLTLRQENVSLRHELHAMQGVLAALYEQCNVGELRAKFKDEVILEMRRQLRQAKAKLKDLAELKNIQREQDSEYKTSPHHSLSVSCVQRRKRRARLDGDFKPSCYNRSDMYESGDDMSSKE